MTRLAQARLVCSLLAPAAPIAVGAQALEAAPPLSRLFAQEAYTEYALLDDPSTASFRILYMPLETERGATVLINGTRHGSDGGDIAVWDPRTGKPLDFEYIGGEQAAKRNLPGRFRPEDHYIVAQLTRPVPVGGEGRVVIQKTYKDARTYYADGPDEIVWVRGLSAMRFGVILPNGYSLDSVNIASQLSTLSDGRLKLALANPSGGGSPVTIRASKSRVRFVENPPADRVFDETKTLYDLSDPTTHRFAVEQTLSDSTRGSRVRIDLTGRLAIQSLEVIDLDTASRLETVTEAAMTYAKLAVPISNDKQSARLKVVGVVEDEAYRVVDKDLVFNGKLHGLRNTLLLPPGWEVSRISQPGTIGRHDGRAFVAFINIFDGEGIDVEIRARATDETSLGGDAGVTKL